MQNWLRTRRGRARRRIRPRRRVFHPRRIRTSFWEPSWQQSSVSLQEQTDSAFSVPAKQYKDVHGRKKLVIITDLPAFLQRNWDGSLDWDVWTVSLWYMETFLLGNLHTPYAEVEQNWVFTKAWYCSPIFQTIDKSLAEAFVTWWGTSWHFCCGFLLQIFLGWEDGIFLATSWQLFFGWLVHFFS